MDGSRKLVCKSAYLQVLSNFRTHSVTTIKPLHTLPPPSLSNGFYFDCSVALLSRQFDRDRDRVISRAQQDNVCGILAWFSDVEKQTLLNDLSKANRGFCYFGTGIHPDNISHTNKKMQDTWIEKIEDLGKEAECISMLSGLNLTRDIGTHFAQESVLRALAHVADKLLLPMILHCPDSNSLDRALEILKEEHFIAETFDDDQTPDYDAEVSLNSLKTRKLLIHDPVTVSGCDATKLKTALSCGCGFIVSAVGITDEDLVIKSKAIACVRSIPTHLMLTGTDSPWHTPLNLPDAYLRTLRNEPSNIPFVNVALYEAMKSDGGIEAFHRMLKLNAIEIFGLEAKDMQEEFADKDLNQTFSNLMISPNTGKENSNTEVNMKLVQVDDLVQVVQDNTDHDEKNEGDHDEDLDCQRQTEIQNDSDVAEKKVTESVDELNQNQSYFGCVKCRTKLFDETLISKHALDTSKTVFGVGEEGLCASVVFIPCASSEQLSLMSKLTVQKLTGSSIECLQCATKLGKFYAKEAYCACGALVQGPIARLLYSKVLFLHVYYMYVAI